MHAAFWRRFGWSMLAMKNRDGLDRPADRLFPAGRKAQAAYRADVVRIMRALCVVASSGPLTPGGGTGPRLEEAETPPASLIGGLLLRGGAPAPADHVSLHRDAPDRPRVAADAFGRPLRNLARGADRERGVVLFGDLDRGWYRLKAGQSGWTPPLWLELGRARTGVWSVA
jgi:hypothetical protein